MAEGKGGKIFSLTKKRARRVTEKVINYKSRKFVVEPHGEASQVPLCIILTGAHGAAGSTTTTKFASIHIFKFLHTV